MHLTVKQSEAFTTWYRERYAPYTGELPILPPNKETAEYAAREKFITKLLGKPGQRPYKNTTRGSRILSRLRLGYGPVFKEKNSMG